MGYEAPKVSYEKNEYLQGELKDVKAQLKGSEDEVELLSTTHSSCFIERRYTCFEGCEKIGI